MNQDSDEDDYYDDDEEKYSERWRNKFKDII